MSESSLSSEYVLDISDLKFRWSKHSPLMHMDSLQVQKGEKVFLKGESGSGKSTLLSLIGGVIEPDSGLLKVLGQDLAKMTAKQRDLFRAEHLGLIFQQFNLIPYLTSIDNVLLTGRWPSGFSKPKITLASAVNAGPEITFLLTTSTL